MTADDVAAGPVTGTGETGQSRYAHRFDIGDVVWVVHGDQPHKEFVLCEGCAGEGGFRIETLRHNRVTCPDCHGRGRIWLDSEVRFYTMTERTIGQVSVVVTTEKPHGRYDQHKKVSVGSGQWRSVEYMATETGVGSGSLYAEARCFATEDEAVAFCEAQGWVTEKVAKSPKAETVHSGGEAQ